SRAGRSRPAPVAATLAAFIAASPAAADTPNEFPARENLSANEVRRVVRQAVAEAEAQGAAATIAVTDRVGNVLAVYVMDGADATVRIFGGDKVDPQGLNRVDVPATLAVISKAITGAYLSSNGNAFSTRTASQIVQENFNPGSETLEGGPLFGVQFSSLPCSDLNTRFESNNGGLIDPRIGPKRSPLGLSADPGGLPLYQNETLVGAIGVLADGVYGADLNVRGVDRDLDEIIAFAGTRGFMAPVDLEAERVHVDGRALRFADAREGFLESDEDDFRDVSLAASGAFVPVPGYSDGSVRAGQAFGFGRSGYRPDRDGIFDNPRAYVLTTPGGANRFPPIDGVGRGAMTAEEVRVILQEALGVALQSRGLIRRPLGSNVEVTISVVDRKGTIVGIVRTPDAPVFGTDVSLQKARTSLLFSRPDAAELIRSAENNSGINLDPGFYADAMLDFVGPAAFDGIAYSTRAIGSLSRPFFPDGRNGGPEGPLSLPIESWSPFNTGIQLDLVLDDLIQHIVGFVIGGGLDVPPSCTDIPLLADGAQIFSGGYPIYRGNRLIGAIGISGDGIDQDAMVAFLGVARAAERLGTGIDNAPRNLRADRLAPLGIQIKYVSCPFAPFVDSDRQNVCQGL
ncbi:MAG TPA: heme-binding protein, partial [Geminicoccaceae bacterium]